MDLNELSNSTDDLIIEVVHRHGESPVIQLTQRNEPWRDPVQVPLESAERCAENITRLARLALTKQAFDKEVIE